jgi:hypothetical protein
VSTCIVITAHLQVYLDMPQSTSGRAPPGAKVGVVGSKLQYEWRPPLFAHKSLGGHLEMIIELLESGLGIRALQLITKLGRKRRFSTARKVPSNAPQNLT